MPLSAAGFLFFAARAIDQYVELRVKASEEKDESEIDPRLETIVEKMVERCGINPFQHL